MKKKTLIAIVDKNLESDHSFIINFLLKKNIFFKVILLCESNDLKKKIVNKNYIIYPILKKRYFLNRIYNLVKIYFFLKKLKKKENKKLNILVRNDPLALLGAYLISGNKDNLIYQSSFPHELSNKIKGFFQKMIFLFLQDIKINIISVSDLGLKRLTKLFPKFKKKMVIPLFSDFKRSKKNIKKKIRYITYVGSHSKLRNLQFIIDAIKIFLKKNQNQFKQKKLKFLFIGSNKNEKIKLINRCNNFRKYFIFIERIKKNKVNNYLNNTCLGISIIPPIEMYLQACPTKIIEYMSCEIPIILNKEIHFQKEILKEGIGYSVIWNKKSIAKGLENFILDKKYFIKKQNTLKLFKKKFNPQIYQKEIYEKILI